MNKAERIKKIREKTGMNRKEFCDYFQIPYRTMTEWECDGRHAPDYVIRLLEYYVQMEKLEKNKDITNKAKKTELESDNSDLSKYSRIYDDIKDLQPEETLKLVTAAKDEEEQKFFALIGNFLLQQRQKQVIERNLF